MGMHDKLVFVVFEDFGHDGCQLCEIFSTRDQAETYAQDQNDARPDSAYSSAKCSVFVVEQRKVVTPNTEGTCK